jgi:hypothetical protein
MNAFDFFGCFRIFNAAALIFPTGSYRRVCRPPAVHYLFLDLENYLRLPWFEVAGSRGEQEVQGECFFC